MAVTPNVYMYVVVRLDYNRWEGPPTEEIEEAIAENTEGYYDELVHTINIGGVLKGWLYLVFKRRVL